MKIKTHILTLLITIFLTAGSAASFEVSGVLEQGGFVIGKTIPGVKVSIDKLSTTSSKDGVFVLPILRNSPEEVVISTLLLEGIEEHHTFKIKQRKYKEQRINGVPKRKVNPNPDDMKIIRADKEQILAARAVFEELPFIEDTFVLPVEGEPFSGVYGSRRVFNGEERSWHKGLDIAAPTGTKVFAPAGGIVRLALENSFFNGNLVIVDHGHQMMTIYAHLDSMAVKVGQKVAAGEQLGTVGQTGRATGPHLHWGLYWRNIALDPMYLLEKQRIINKKAEG